MLTQIDGYKKEVGEKTQNKIMVGHAPDIPSSDGGRAASSAWKEAAGQQAQPLLGKCVLSIGCAEWEKGRTISSSEESVMRMGHSTVSGRPQKEGTGWFDCSRFPGCVACSESLDVAQGKGLLPLR